MVERAFVMLPLSEIEPGLTIPGENKTVTELLQKLDKTGIHKLDPDKME
jgi:7,8-dihydro-6-hydroxymethylpterin-pyrophosphokinase